MKTSRTISSAPHGMTVVELMISLVVMSLVMAALASITLAVGEGWQSNDGSQSLQIQAAQAANQLNQIFVAAKFVGQYQAGSVNGSATTPASIFFWKADNFANPPTCYSGDGQVQVGEMALIQHDTTTGSLFLYQAIPISSMTASQLTRASITMAYSDMSLASNVAAFKQLDFVTSSVLAGPGSSPTPGTHATVTGCQFYVSSLTSTTQLPVIEFTLTMTRGTNSTVQYGSSTMRGPTTQPN